MSCCAVRPSRDGQQLVGEFELPAPEVLAVVIGSFKCAPEDAGVMPGGSGRRAVTFKAKQSQNPAHNAHREAVMGREIRFFQQIHQRSEEPGYDRIIEFLPERSCLGPQACLTLEVVQPFGCDLFQYLVKPSGSTMTLIKAVSQICEALSFLQNCGVVHGDLKCENVLLTATNDIKLIDLGLAANEGEEEWWPGADNIPPKMRKKTMPAEFYQDLFGLGYIIQQFLMGNRAFKKEVPRAAVAQGLLIAGRMTLDELVQEPWLSGVQCSRCSGISLPNNISTRIPSECSTRISSDISTSSTGSDVPSLSGSRMDGIPAASAPAAPAVPKTGGILRRAVAWGLVSLALSMTFVGRF
jgi:hypothetical protein